jgi:protein involved in polysaccharide export with SLBB domain
LAQFGYDLFRTTVSTFVPLTDVPVGPDYIVGPGDRFTIFIWGRFEFTHPVEVDRNGEISLPKLGVLKVWGLTFSQLNDYLMAEFS